MKEIRFVGRKQEMEKLEELYAEKEFQMVIIYGRRRVGKTTLINEFCKNKKTIFCVGIESTGKKNLENFSKEVWKKEGYEDMPPFKNFEGLFSHAAKIAENEQIVFVIDEYPYLAEAVPAISSILQACIDHQLLRGRMFLILCGSSMSIMEHQVLGYKSPLYGRRTAQFKILPFDFWESCLMLDGFSKEEQAILYGATGGVPEYLSRIRNDQSVKKNLTKLFFTSAGRLFEEPSNLLKQELRSPSTYNAILAAIADGHSKQNEIATEVGIPTGGCSNLLKSLIELGIVAKETPVTEQTSKKTIYHIQDQMFRFWYRFVGPNVNMITAGHGELVYDNLVESALSDFMGNVFEKISADWMIKQLSKGQFPFFFSKIGRWWGGNPKTHLQEEIDIMALGKDMAAFGECKWTNQPVDKQVLVKLLERAELFAYPEKYLYIFSKKGFTKGCLEATKENEKVQLVFFAQM